MPVGRVLHGWVELFASVSSSSFGRTLVVRRIRDRAGGGLGRMAINDGTVSVSVRSGTAGPEKNDCGFVCRKGGLGWLMSLGKMDCGCAMQTRAVGPEGDCN